MNYANQCAIVGVVYAVLSLMIVYMLNAMLQDWRRSYYRRELARVRAELMAGDDKKMDNDVEMTENDTYGEYTDFVNYYANDNDDDDDAPNVVAYEMTSVDGYNNYVTLDADADDDSDGYNMYSTVVDVDDNKPIDDDDDGTTPVNMQVMGVKALDHIDRTLCMNAVYSMKLLSEWEKARTRVCQYEHDNDTNGILYYLGTHRNKNTNDTDVVGGEDGTSEWLNPSLDGSVKVTASGISRDSDRLEMVTGRSEDIMIQIEASENDGATTKKRWLQIELRRCTVVLTGIYFHFPDVQFEWHRSDDELNEELWWVVETSMDGNEWQKVTKCRVTKKVVEKGDHEDWFGAYVYRGFHPVASARSSACRFVRICFDNAESDKDEGTHNLETPAVRGKLMHLELYGCVDELNEEQRKEISRDDDDYSGGEDVDENAALRGPIDRESSLTSVPVTNKEEKAVSRVTSVKHLMAATVCEAMSLSHALTLIKSAHSSGAIALLVFTDTNSPSRATYSKLRRCISDESQHGRFVLIKIEHTVLEAALYFDVSYYPTVLHLRPNNEYTVVMGHQVYRTALKVCEIPRWVYYDIDAERGRNSDICKVVAFLCTELKEMLAGTWTSFRWPFRILFSPLIIVWDVVIVLGIPFSVALLGPPLAFFWCMVYGVSLTARVATNNIDAWRHGSYLYDSCYTVWRFLTVSLDAKIWCCVSPLIVLFWALTVAVVYPCVLVWRLIAPRAVLAVSNRGESMRIDDLLLAEAEYSLDMTKPRMSRAVAAMQSHLVNWADAFAKARTMSGEEMEYVVRAFESYARAAVDVIISERVLKTDDEQRLFPPIAGKGFAGGQKYFHREANCFFKFAYDDKGLFGGSDEYAMKSAMNELRAMNSVLETEPERLNFPLMCVIRKHGHCVIAVAALAIDSDTLVYGSADGGRTVHHDDAQAFLEMEQLARHFHLKPHTIGDSGVRLPTAGDVEVHRMKNGGELWALDFGRFLPPTSEEAIWHEHFRPEAMSAAPWAIDGVTNLKDRGDDYLQLNGVCADAFSRFVFEDEAAEMNESAVRARRFMLEGVIPEAAHDLTQRLRSSSDIEWVFKDKDGVVAKEEEDDDDDQAVSPSSKKKTLSVLLHSRGINMRDLGVLRDHVSVGGDADVMDIRHDLLVEMVIRGVIKRRWRRICRTIVSSDERAYAFVFVHLLHAVLSSPTDVFWSNVVPADLNHKYKVSSVTTEELSKVREVFQVPWNRRLTKQVEEQLGVKFHVQLSRALFTYNEELYLPDWLSIESQIDQLRRNPQRIDGLQMKSSMAGMSVVLFLCSFFTGFFGWAMVLGGRSVTEDSSVFGLCAYLTSVMHVLCVLFVKSEFWMRDSRIFVGALLVNMLILYVTTALAGDWVMFGYISFFPIFLILVLVLWWLLRVIFGKCWEIVSRKCWELVCTTD